MDIKDIIRQSANDRQAGIQVAAPMNDIQLVAQIAASRPDLTPQEAVAWAIEIVVEAVKSSKTMMEKLKAAVQSQTLSGR